MAIDPRIPAVVAAAALVIPDSPAYRAGSPKIFVTVTGNTAITSIAAMRPGTELTMHFQGTPTLTDGSNLVLAGNLVATADDICVLICDGVTWYEQSRSVN
jgi:hypothetical protein